MMKSPCHFNSRIQPNLDDFQDKEAIPHYQGCTSHPAFEMSKIFVDERGTDPRRRHGARPKVANLSISAPEILPQATTFSAIYGGNVQDTGLGGPQQAKRIIVVTDDATHQGRFKLQHGVPRMVMRLGRSRPVVVIRTTDPGSRRP